MKLLNRLCRIFSLFGIKIYHMLHNQVDNKLLPKVASYCRISSFLNNTFGKRLNSDIELIEQIVSQLSSSDVMDFPEMTEMQLKILFTGSYQLKQAISYLAETMDADQNILINCLKETSNILKMEIRSRHSNSKVYKCYIDYELNSVGHSGIKRYCCECPNGNRTVGCCSHIAAVIYYLSHGRYLSKIPRPSEVLSKLFRIDNVPAVINEDSDED